MSSIQGLLNISQFESSYATKLPESEGKKQYRLCLDGSKVNRTKIAVRWTFVNLIYFFDRLFAALGLSTRKWVKINVEEKNGSVREMLININSLCQRTLFKRNEIMQLNPTQLSQTLAKLPADKAYEYKTLNQLFPHITLIGMNSRKEKIEAFQKHLSITGLGSLQYKVLPAVNGGSLSSDAIDSMSKSQLAIKHNKDDRADRLGAFLSHLNAIRNAKVAGHSHVLILEDNVRFDSDFLAGNYLQKALLELPKDWGILFVGHHDKNKDKAKNYSEHLVKPGFPTGLHSWAISSSMYDTVINALENERKKGKGQVRSIESVISEIFVPTGKVFATKQNAAIQDEDVCPILGKKTRGNYNDQLTKLEKRFPTHMAQGKVTADGMPIMDPLLAGTLYQLLYHVDQVFNKHGLEYTIDGGNALGGKRNGALIPHDDDIDVTIKPSTEKILKDPKFIQDLKNVGLRIEDHWLGAKIFAIKDHPLGKSIHRDGCYYKTPDVDVFFTKHGKTKSGEDAYFYTAPIAAWADEHIKVSEFSGKKGQNRIDFGPIKANTLVDPHDFLVRWYDTEYMDEVRVQWDHINDCKLERRPVRITDFRSPAYTQWDGLPFIPNIPKSTVKK